MHRRSFLISSACTGLAAAAPSIRAQAPTPAPTRPAIGLDHFAVRAAELKAPQLIDYAASLKAESLFLSELGPFESFEEDYLKQLKTKADAAGLKLYSGGMSICPTSASWKPTWGTPEEHLTLLIRIAKTLGSPVARCVLGNNKDRLTDGGIQKHMEATIKVIKACRTRAEGEGIKISIENHAGDMQSHELKALIEEAGKEYVGANIDPGNAVWAMEDPLLHLETLGPYVNCSSVRDSMVWENEQGAVVQWTAVGEGLVDFKAYGKRFAELAPGVPLHVETISGFARPMPFKQADFWKAYPGYQDTPAFASWLTMARRGNPIEVFKAPDGEGKKAAEVAYHKGELERSLNWLRTNL